MNFDMVMQILRYALLTAGPYVTAHGWANGDQWAAITGALITVFTAVWGVYVNWGATKVPDAVAKTPEVPTVNPITGTTKTGEGL